MLAARADDLEAWTRLQNDDWRAARPLAEKAHDVAVQVGNADLYSGAGRTLAVIRLHRDEAAEAYEVASVAARYGMRLYQPELLAIAGVAALRCGNVGDRTRLAFTGAVGLAEDLLPGAPDAGLLYEARGLAFAGLALLDGSDEGEAEAAQAYGKAIELCGAAGARRRHELFHALVAKRPDALPVLRGLLG